MNVQEKVSVLTIQTMADGTRARVLTTYGDIDKALVGHWGGLRAAVNDPNCVKIVSEVINDDGHVEKCERWGEDPEPEESEGNE